MGRLEAGWSTHVGIRLLLFYSQTLTFGFLFVFKKKGVA